MVFAAGALLIGLAACTISPSGGSFVSVSPVGSGPAALSPGARRETTFTLPSANGATTNRLLVLGDDGNIYVTRPDGNETQALSHDAGPSHLYEQPAWSPLGDRVAWVEAVDTGNEVTSSLHVSRPDGSGAVQVATTAPPFYISWSPDGSRLAYLANGSQGIDLNLFDPGSLSHPIQMLDQGSPLYFSWSPDGQHVLAHVGSDRLSLIMLDGAKTDLASRPADFAAPLWGPDRASLVYGTVTGGKQRLVVADLNGTAQRELAGFDGHLTFELRPDGQQVAYVDTVLQVPTAAFGPLYVAGAAGSAVQLISEGPVLAFFWSPDGRYLLYLTLDQTDVPSGARQASFHLQQDQPLWMRWHVWDRWRSIGFERFVPSQTMLEEYLAFFDQYARSMTLWAPDSSDFTYAGTGEDGQDGIWVQNVKEGTPAVRVAPGVMASWSPH
jgi:TolB protein